MGHNAEYDPSPLISQMAASAGFPDSQEQRDEAEHNSALKRRTNLAELVRFIITECGEPVRVLEFYYWSQQLGLDDAVRTLASLPEQKRATIQTFLAMVQNPASISVTINASGELVLDSPEVAANLDAFRRALA